MLLSLSLSLSSNQLLATLSTAMVAKWPVLDRLLDWLLLGLEQGSCQDPSVGLVFRLRALSHRVLVLVVHHLHRGQLRLESHRGYVEHWLLA